MSVFPKLTGWYQVELKNTQTKEFKDKNKLADKFTDWVFYSKARNEWDIKEYESIGFYVSSIIKSEVKQG